MNKAKMTNSLRFKFLSVSFITCVMLYIITIAGSGVFYYNALQTRYTNLCKSVSEVISGTIDADEVDSWLNGQNTHSYVQATNKLSRLSGDIPSLDSLIIYQMREDGMYTVYNIKSTGVRSDLGTVVNYDSKWRSRKDDFLAGEQVDNLMVIAYSGKTVMYCTPIFDSGNKCVAYVCSGVSKSVMNRELLSFLKNFSLILCVIIGALFILMSVYINAKIVRPIKRIGEAMKNSAKKGSVEYMSALSSLNINNTGGEIENILKSSIKVFSDKVQLSTKMREEQKDVMLAFSTLIKSVNLDTAGYADHISGYVDVLCAQMRTKEKYAKILTKELCDNIILAAPLHDVGKLTVPDDILYKPGKLTPEEFEIVKDHAENGAKIIEETMKDLPEAEYLELARDIALAHHERWDGRGYPRALKGEEIPLTARIIAVADVFDALVSKRCYKEAATVDEAYKIMLDDEGHFDPDILQCFVEAKAEIIREYNSIDYSD